MDYLTGGEGWSGLLGSLLLTCCPSLLVSLPTWWRVTGSARPRLIIFSVIKFSFISFFMTGPMASERTRVFKILKRSFGQRAVTKYINDFDSILTWACFPSEAILSTLHFTLCDMVLSTACFSRPSLPERALSWSIAAFITLKLLGPSL